MKYLVIAAAAVFASLTTTSASAQNRFKDCAAQWNAMKEAKQTEGKNYRAFQKECLSKSSELAKEAGADDIKSSKPKKKRSAKAKTDKPAADAKPSTPAQAAATARRRECSAEWKADKAAGKVADGMKWPQYYSACNTRKKGAAA